MKIKPLLAIGCPRFNIEPVMKHWPDLPCDKLLIKFLPECNAHPIQRNYFLNQGDWTHLIMSLDDLIVTRQNYDSLIDVLEKDDLPVVSGVCNVDETDFDVLNITMPSKMPKASTPYLERKYDWILNTMESNQDHLLLRVGFSGFPLMAIRRDIVAKIPFETDYEALHIPFEHGKSTDLMFCIRCMQQDIPIYADVKNYMRHLRHAGEMRVGKEPPDAVFYKYNNT